VQVGTAGSLDARITASYSLIPHAGPPAPTVVPSQVAAESLGPATLPFEPMTLSSQS
jgi:hypothetical protein